MHWEWLYIMHFLSYLQVFLYTFQMQLYGGSAAVAGLWISWENAAFPSFARSGRDSAGHPAVLRRETRSFWFALTYIIFLFYKTGKQKETCAHFQTVKQWFTSIKNNHSAFLWKQRQCEVLRVVWWYVLKRGWNNRCRVLKKPGRMRNTKTIYTVELWT